jgi:selenocysteine lyase/cysteine desulfurase
MNTQYEHPDSLNGAYEKFLKEYPAYQSTHILDELRQTEYGRLGSSNHVYLDYTGGGLYAQSQLNAHMDFLKDRVLGNPHSSNPSSMESTHFVESTRRAVLEYFQADPNEYVAIFTQNASGACKLVGESFPFSKNDHYLLTFDNHNSVNGIREFARAHDAEVTYVPVTLPDLRVDEDQLECYLDMANPGGNNLFAFPAQSNFSGVQHSLEWIAKAQARGWVVMLDAAAFVPTNILDLGKWKPDFVPISFYKMFGYPTGVGCLLARKSALSGLHRPWFAGGTITVASVQGDKYYLAPGEAAFEEGTLDYLNIPAVEIGLRHIQAIGMDCIHERVHCLAGWLIKSLLDIRCENQMPSIKIYGPSNMERRGGTITMNFFDNHGVSLDHRTVEKISNQATISLRTGCFCNPGAGEIALEITKPELESCFAQPIDHLTLDDFRVCIDGKRSGAVRISLGLASNFADVFNFIQFVKDLVKHACDD